MFYLAFRDVFLDRKTVFSVYVLKKKEDEKEGNYKILFLLLLLN